MSENENEEVQAENNEPTPGTNEEIDNTTTDEATGEELVVPERDKDAVLPEVDPEDVNETPEYPGALKTDSKFTGKKDKRPFSAELPEGKSKAWGITMLQHRLKARGYNLEATGHMDDATKEALKAFGEDNDVSVGTTVTQEVWDAVVESN